MRTNISLYKKTYNKNICFCYTRRRITKTNISLIHESVFLLYEMMYNRNIYFHYTIRCIMKINISSVI